MIYEKTLRGRFIDRPNRFIAHVEIGGRSETVHVKNTGRCRELLLPDAEVILQESDDPKRLHPSAQVLRGINDLSRESPGGTPG